MKKVILLLLVSLLIINVRTRADEGMWLLTLLQKINYERMKQMGLQLSAEDIYSVNKSCLKDGVVGLSEGQSTNFNCSSELVSAEGLLLTNHHCGYDNIQSHSSVENNYVEDGFWATSRDKELPCAGKTASFLIRIEDVTGRILPLLSDTMSDESRKSKIEELSAQIKDDAIKDNHYRATVKDFFNGNQFFLLVYETFLDVRLVGAPPNSIGSFGGETDNWVWPRHNADFCLFRIYTGPDGKPAEYSKDNIPLKSKYFFPVSIKGVENGDFSMIMGYPGTTHRYLTSWGVEETMNITNDIRVKVRTKKLQSMKEYMDKDEKIYIQYTSKYNSSSNYWKYSIGQNKGIKNLNVINKKQNLEKQLSDWINTDDSKRKQYNDQIEDIVQTWKKGDMKRNEKYIKTLEDVLDSWSKLGSADRKRYSDALDILKQAYTERASMQNTMQYLEEAMLEGPEIIMFAYESFNLYNTLARDSENALAIAENTEEYKKKAEKHFKDYYAPIDQKLFAEMFKLYYENVSSNFHPYVMSKVETEYGGDFDKFAEAVFKESVFTDKQRLFDFLNKPNMETSIWKCSQLITFASNLNDLYNSMKNKNAKKQEDLEQIDQIKKAANEFFVNYNAEKDKENLVAEFKKFYKDTEKKYQPSIFIDIENEYGGNFEKFAKNLFKKSIFADKAKFDKFMEDPKLEILENDLGFKTMLSIYKNLKSVTFQQDPAFQSMIAVLITYYGINNQLGTYENRIEKGERLLMAALMEMQKDKDFYPDANSTMRLTYGKVGDYKPANAVQYKYYTTLKGVMEKEDPSNREFVVKPKLKELYNNKDYGRYAKDGEMRVCFTTNNDITGGNSGSPVINGKGELIGIAFDGNWEAMSGDIIYEPDIQKTICVDIRYVLFIIDKYANAQNLIKELKIVE